MSNSRVRREIEAKERGSKALQKYKQKEDIITNYQLSKAYLKDKGASVSSIVETILRKKYNLPWQQKYIHKAVVGVRGQKNPIISIPQFKYEDRVENILSKFVHKNFGMMVVDSNENDAYPIMFKKIVENS